MPRPCEDVIIISDAEEGELLEVDDDEEDDVPEGSEREEGEIPDDDINAIFIPPTITTCQDQIDIHKRNTTINNSMPISFEKPFVSHTKLKYRVYRAATNGFSRERYSRHINIKKAYSRSKYHITPEAKIRRKCQKMDESSDSDTERVLKNSKLISLGMSRKIHSSSLESRLSNMLKYTKTLCKSHKPKNGIKIRKENGFDENLEEMKDNHIISNNADNFSDNTKNDDDDLDILRELALKSKTQRAPKKNEINNSKNDTTENDELNRKDVDKELEELRLDALKSAMLKKAFKRKRIKNDKKEKKAISTPINEKEIDLNPNTLSPISLENNVGNLMYDYSNSNYEYYNSFMYNELEKVVETNTANKENTESQPTHNSSDEDEETLRQHLLLTLKNKKQKLADSPQEVPSPKINVKHDDSNLIIRLGGSDTESDCEETKNLALMHARLMSQNEFHRNLECYLKEARQSVDKLNFETNTFSNSSNKNNPEALKIRRNQLLNQLAKLEEIKLARKEALKKSVEIRKLQKKPIIQRKISISSQNGDAAIKKDSKRILKPSMLINRRPSLSIADKSPSIDKGQKALGQQLIFIRKKIAQHNQTLKRTQNQMKDLQKQKEAYIAQIRSATFSLKTTENALTSSAQSVRKTVQQLSLLQKHHLMLQNRFLKISSKTNEESIPFTNNNIKENRVSNVQPSIQNNTKSTEKAIIVNVPNTKPATIVEKSVSSDQSQTVSEHSLVLNSSKESEISSNNMSLEELPKPVENTDQDKITDNQLILLPPLLPKTEKRVISFTEYETPLTGMKSNQSWIGDPHAILCPFDVSGCCKDASCNYYHPKICKM